MWTAVWDMADSLLSLDEVTEATDQQVETHRHLIVAAADGVLASEPTQHRELRFREIGQALDLNGCGRHSVLARH